jgi:glycosyltransferase involved in cell wall biosynthesis
MNSDKKKTIAVLVNHAWVAWKFRLNLLQHLRLSGYRVALLTDCGKGHFNLEGSCDVLVDVPTAAKHINPWADLKTLYIYSRELARLKPAAVLTFTIKPNIYGALAAHGLGFPVIANVTGLGSASSGNGFVGRVVKLLYRWALRKNYWVYFQNSNDSAAMHALGLVPEGRSSILPGSGVEVGRYPANQRRNEGSALRFCMLARLLRDKGVLEFAEAARLVRKESAGVSFELWGILDSADVRCVSEEEVLAWDAEGVLEFRGPANDASQAFAGADVVVLPSYYPEGLPRTLLEAAAMSLPAITTDMPGCRDAVVDGVTGLLCPPRDASALAKAMLRLISMSPEERAQMGAAGRERVLARFDERLVLDAYTQKLAETSQFGFPRNIPDSYAGN